MPRGRQVRRRGVVPLLRRGDSFGYFHRPSDGCRLDDEEKRPRIFVEVGDVLAGAAMIDDDVQQPPAHRAVHRDPQRTRRGRGGAACLPRDAELASIADERVGLLERGPDLCLLKTPNRFMRFDPRTSVFGFAGAVLAPRLTGLVPRKRGPHGANQFPILAQRSTRQANWWDSHSRAHDTCIRPSVQCVPSEGADDSVASRKNVSARDNVDEYPTTPHTHRDHGKSRHIGRRYVTTDPTIRTLLPIAVGMSIIAGCRTIPGQDVRYEPTPMPVVRAMLTLANVGPQDIVYDLGSGDGRIVIAAAQEFSARGVGIEIDTDLVARAEANARAAGVSDKVEFRLGDMYAADLRAATVVTLFLHPRPNLKLRPKLRSELRPGARIVSYIWDMGDWAPDEVRRVNNRQIMLWRIPPRPTK